MEKNSDWYERNFDLRVWVDDFWWVDPRRRALIKAINEEISEEKSADPIVKAGAAVEEFVDGCAIAMWQAARRYGGLVPREIFNRIPISQGFIDVNLADDRGDHVYVRGKSIYLGELHGDEERS